MAGRWVQGSDRRDYIESQGIIAGQSIAGPDDGEWTPGTPIHAVDPSTGITACGVGVAWIFDDGKWPISMGACRECFDLTAGQSNP